MLVGKRKGEWGCGGMRVCGVVETGGGVGMGRGESEWDKGGEISDGVGELGWGEEGVMGLEREERE